jgi:hypothetical protein
MGTGPLSPNWNQRGNSPACTIADGLADGVVSTGAGSTVSVPLSADRVHESRSNKNKATATFCGAATFGGADTIFTIL